MRHPAGSVDELRGLRAARWIRESTPGQFDRYGPEAQRELQDGAMRSLGLIDTGLEWRAAHSGRTVYRSPEMAGMMAAAERGEFEVLLVGYVSRWQRNLRQTLNLLEDSLHPAGVAVYFADEEILSSNERHWDQLVDEAKDAERFSRKHSRRVREGYASKRTKEHDPGGHPPYGFRRDEAKLLEPDPANLATVRQVFGLAAAGHTDADVAARTGPGSIHGPRHPDIAPLRRPAAGRERGSLGAVGGPGNLGCGRLQESRASHQRWAPRGPTPALRVCAAPLRRLRQAPNWRHRLLPPPPALRGFRGGCTQRPSHAAAGPTATPTPWAPTRASWTPCWAT